MSSSAMTKLTQGYNVKPVRFVIAVVVMVVRGWSIAIRSKALLSRNVRKSARFDGVANGVVSGASSVVSGFPTSQGFVHFAVRFVLLLPLLPVFCLGAFAIGNAIALKFAYPVLKVVSALALRFTTAIHALRYSPKQTATALVRTELLNWLGYPTDKTLFLQGSFS